MLTMANITDDETESLLRFVRRIAEMKLYGTEMEVDVDDAIETANDLIETARRHIARFVQD